MKIKSRQVLHLERSALRELIVQGLKERGFETTGAVKVDFVADSEGEVAVLVENMRPPEEEKPTGGPRKAGPRISGKREKGGTVTAAISQRENVDFVTQEEIPKGTECVWVSGLGITATPPEEWPAGLWTELGMLKKDRAVFAEALGKKEPESEADVAADVLGGEGGVMGRGDALAEGSRDPMLDMDGISGSWDGE